MSDPHRDLEQLRNDLAAYALGAASPAEAEEIERHIETCDACGERLDWLRPAVDQLPATVEQLTPPDRLRESLMATVRAEAAQDAPASQGARAAPVRPSRGSWLDGLRAGLWRPATGFAVLIVLVAGLATGWLLRGDSESEFFPAKAVSAAAPAASATLERHGDSATLHVNELPALDRDQVYEVWIQRAGVMEPSSTFVLARDHSAEAAIPGPLEGAEAVYVTVEPRPGSNRPTSKPVLQAPLQ